jgi:hypothetical protein
VLHTSIVYKTFIDNLNRKSLNLSNDIRSIYNNKGKFKVIYTDNHTHLTKNPDYVAIDPLVEETKIEKECNNTFNDLFEST